MVMFKPGTVEELYDLNNDPHEVNNLANDESYADILKEHGDALDEWVAKTGDLSAIPEPELIEMMWPGRKQPKTNPVSARMIDDEVYLTNITEGASIGYRYINEPKSDQNWQLYNGPINIGENAIIEAKAIRYGYKESDISMFEKQQLSKGRIEQ